MENIKVNTIINDLASWELDDLHELSKEVELIIKGKSSSVQIELFYNRYKGSGKCWIAEVDKTTKKILNFIDAESTIKTDNYKGSKIFVLKDGYYITCEAGSKSNDQRNYIKVENGKISDF